MRILVDTNILLRIAQPGSPHHHDALAALDVLEQAGHELCLVPQVANARRFKMDLSPYPVILRIDSACQALTAFSDALPERQPDAF